MGAKKHGNMVDPLTALPVAWEIWRSRNVQVFENKSLHDRTIEALMVKMEEEVRAWCLAGANRFKEFVLGA